MLYMLYICLYITFSSSYIATLASIIVYNYKTIIEPINRRGLSNKPFTSITFTSIKPFTSITFTFNKPFTCSFTLAASYSNILLMRTSLARR
jgi:hypothetical protein